MYNKQGTTLATEKLETQIKRAGVRERVRERGRDKRRKQTKTNENTPKLDCDPDNNVRGEKKGPPAEPRLGIRITSTATRIFIQRR